MKDNYDFSKGVKNPYVKKLKKQITIRIDVDSVDYFKEQATEIGISYQNLINLYLRDCVDKKRNGAAERRQRLPRISGYA